MNNIEKIKEMSEEKLIALLDEHGFCSAATNCREFDNCAVCIKNWINETE